ncbi:Armadillo repeat-containing protein 6 [Morella rubra]|uniref:Armadillo repeat-containing protein 6 n=1 Tax=Morella rubra TaxID=262757 RepID=A0A6A1V3A8_9ROSI|nr:Armadillo repeat-containing protein 6 [Morella rubra]
MSSKEYALQVAYPPQVVFESPYLFLINACSSVITLALRLRFHLQLQLQLRTILRIPAQMAPPKTQTEAVRTISQEAFDDLVKENMEDLGMDPTEALQDAIQTLTLQGVDLAGLVTCLPGEGGVKDNLIIQSLDTLKRFDADFEDQIGEKGLDEMGELVEKLTELCGVPGSGNAAIATRNGGVELLCSMCSKVRNGRERFLISALKTLASLLHDLKSTETFRASSGPKTVAGILNDYHHNVDVLNNAFAVVAAASTGNEVLKESFMELKIDELIMRVLSYLSGQSKGSIPSLYDAIQVLLTSDDNRVVASQALFQNWPPSDGDVNITSGVYGYARRFAKIGVARALVGSLHEGLGSPGVVSASFALKAVAVNDEICKSIAESGGIDAVLRCIEDSGEQGNKIVARACCSLLAKLAGSDANKAAIVEKGGLDSLIKLSARFSDDPSVLQEVMYIISVLSLRSPENAARAIEAGAGDLVIQAMEKFPAAQQMQRNSCLMIRNLVVRNPENSQYCGSSQSILVLDVALHTVRTIDLNFNQTVISEGKTLLLDRTLLLSNGVDKYIRKAKQSHESCKDAASDALRDLGLDYNL